MPVRRRRLEEDALVRAPRPRSGADRSPVLLPGAGNRAISALIASRSGPQVQREDDDDFEEAGDDTSSVEDVAEPDVEQGPVVSEESPTEEIEEDQETGDEQESSSEETSSEAEQTDGGGDPVEEVSQAIAETVDPAAVTDGFRQDAAGQNTEDGAGTELQALRLGVQRDTPPGPPAPPRAGDASDILDAVLALKAISDLIDRISDLAIKQIKKAGAPATIVLGAVALPPLIAGLNQGAGVTKLVLKTPQIDLGTDRQGVKRSIQFRLEIKVDPTTGGAATLGAAVTF